MELFPRRPHATAPIAVSLQLCIVATSIALSPSDHDASAAPSTATVARETSGGSHEAPLELGDAFTVEYDGGWFCPQDPGRLSVQICPPENGEGGSSRQFVERLIEDVVAHPELDPPGYMRVAKARRFCSLADWPGGMCATATPARPGEPCLDPALPPRQFEVTSPYCALQGLKDVGIKLGVIMGAERHAADGTRPPRSVEELTYHACKINEADDIDLYDFMFLDQAFKLSNAELKDVVSKIQSGITWNPASGQYETCRYGSWPRLITNDTTYPRRTLATGAWAHAKRFEVLGRTGESLQPAIDAASGKVPAITTKDLNFIRDVYETDPGSHPILRFEVPSQTDRFSQLGKGVQCKLLRRWAEQQQKLGYSMLFPLYVHGVPAKPRTYDSFFRGTFHTQRELIHYYHPDVEEPILKPCPQPPA